MFEEPAPAAPLSANPTPLTLEELEAGQVEPMIMGDEILRGHDQVSALEAPNINPLAAPPLLGSAYTVTVVNPSPPTNISYVACGSPPNYTATYKGDGWHKANALVSDQVTFTDDLNLFTGAGTPAALTVISSPIGGGSGPTSEATGTVVVVTAPGSRAECPTQAISVQGNYTTTPNASHPSSVSTIRYLVPAAPASGGGTLALTVSGIGFNSGSVVSVGVVAQTTVFVNSETLTVAAAPRKATAGAVAVLVTTNAVASPAINWTFS